MTDLRQHAKRSNFGQPAMPFPISSAHLVWLLAYFIWEGEARRSYADEREYPEYVDLGGEG